MEIQVKTIKSRNYVAKFMPTTGSGCHKAKKGKHTPRRIQTRDWKKEAGL